MPGKLIMPGLEFDAWLIDTNPIVHSDFSFVVGHRKTCVIFPTVKQIGFSHGGVRGEVYQALRTFGATPIESTVAIRTMPLVEPSYGTVRLWTDDVHPNKEPALFGFKIRTSPKGRVACHHDMGSRSDVFAPSVRIAASYRGAIPLQ